MNPTPEYQPPDALEDAPPGPYRTLLLSRGSVVALALTSFLFVVLLFIVFAQPVQFLNLPLGLIVSSLLLFGTAGLFFPALLGQNPFRFTGLSHFPAALVGLGFLLGAANLPFANFLMGALREFMPDSWVHSADEVTRLLVRADSTTRVLLVVGAGLAAPIGEELFFRGWMQRITIQRYSVIASVLVVAFAFSFIHLDPVGFVARLELGILFGLVSVWSRSLWPSIAMHAAHNLLSTAALYVVSDDPLKELEQPFEWGPAAAFGLFGLLLMLALVRLFRRVAAAQPVPEPVVPQPPRVTAGPALRVALVACVLATVSIVVMWKGRDTLPGQELTRSGREQLFRMLNPLHPAHPK